MSRAYRHLPALEMRHGNYAIRCIEDQDIEAIRRWRNAQVEVLRQSGPISASDQRAYFDRAIWPQMGEEQPERILVAIEQSVGGSGPKARGATRELIGYGGFVHCAWDHARAEISALFAPAIVADKEHYRKALLAFLAMMTEAGFARLGLRRLTLETYDIRPFHVSVIEEAGFVREGRLREHVEIDGRPIDSLLNAKLASD